MTLKQKLFDWMQVFFFAWNVCAVFSRLLSPQATEVGSSFTWPYTYAELVSKAKQQCLVLPAVTLH